MAPGVVIRRARIRAEHGRRRAGRIARRGSGQATVIGRGSGVGIGRGSDGGGNTGRFGIVVGVGQRIGCRQISPPFGHGGRKGVGWEDEVRAEQEIGK